MKLAVAMALLRIKPREFSTEVYVKNVSLSWQNRNHRDTQYIQWLELERLQLLQKTALLTCAKEKEEDNHGPCSSSGIDTTPPVTFPVEQVNIPGSCLEFLKSTIRFLQLTPRASVTLPNYNEILDVTTEDLVRHIRELMRRDGEMFVDTFSRMLEQCCMEYRHVLLSETCVRNLVQLAELLADFVASLKSNKLLPEDELKVGETSQGKVEEVAMDTKDENPFTENKPKSENDEIKLLLAPRSEKQVIVNCIVELSRNSKLREPVQRVFCAKILEICGVIDGNVIAKKPEVLDSLYYFTEGLSKSGPVDGENVKMIKKCIDLTIVKFPVAARLLLVCCSGNQHNSAFNGS